MKTLSFLASLLIVGTESAFALTEADITPAALVGKTLRFTATSGAAPLPASGVWTGTFAASGDGFTVADVSSGTTALTTTYSASSDNGTTSISLLKFGANQDIAILYLYFLKGEPTYAVQSTISLSEGTFTIDPAVVNGPEIDVRQPNKSGLIDGVSKKNLGSVRVSKTGTAQKFVIKNTGNAPLDNLAITLDGKNKTDFIVSRLKKTQLAEDESIGFTVKFKPSATGKRTAALHIQSNDADEESFDITLTGSGKSNK